MQEDALHVLVRVRVPVGGIAVAVPVAAVRVRVMEEEHAHQVHQQPEHRRRQQVVAVDLGRLPQPLQTLEDDGAGDEHEEDGVHEAGEHLVPRVAVRVHLVLAPLGHVAGVEADEERRVVEEHVPGVADEAQRVRPQADDDLDEHEGHVDRQEDEDLARVRVVEHVAQHLAHRAAQVAGAVVAVPAIQRQVALVATAGAAAAAAAHAECKPLGLRRRRHDVVADAHHRAAAQQQQAELAVAAEQRQQHARGQRRRERHSRRALRLGRAARAGGAPRRL
mmetsp:Transcript_6600/g.23523  ORF Transcript_6600/g.23523 Transcript_6600/m.23523 type:complete len:278 (-) Transcript_6600:333-1166(-)